MKIKNKILTEEYITYTFETGIDDSEDFDFDLSNEQVKEVVDKFLSQEKQENRLSDILTDIIYSKDGKSIDYSVIENMTDFFKCSIMKIRNTPNIMCVHCIGEAKIL